MPQQMILHASMKIKDPTCYNYNLKKKHQQTLEYFNTYPSNTCLPPSQFIWVIWVTILE